MKQAGGGFAPSYNAQISTDGKHGLIVAVDVTQAGNDCHQLAPAAEQIEQRCGRKPGRMVADAGYTSRENIQELAEKNIDFVGEPGGQCRQSQNEPTAVCGDAICV